MIKKITIPPTSTPVEVTAESIDGKLSLSPNGLVATVAPSDLTLSATPGTPIVTPPPVVVDPPPVVVPPVSGPGIPASARLVFSSDFNNGFNNFYLVDAGGGRMVPAQVGKGVIADDPTQPGNKTFKAIVLKGGENISNGYRSELTLPIGDTGEMWYSYRQYFQTLGQGGGGHSVQWHPGNSTGSATLALYTDYGKFNVVRNLKGLNYYQNGGKSIELKKWYNITWRVKWSTGSDGLVELYIDGEKYYTYSGPTMGSDGVYFKFGINRWAFTNDWVIFYDDLKVYKA